ncbi:MAG TPA: hypothetical protein VF765_01385 [Polyangiaceae bacterium]
MRLPRGLGWPSIRPSTVFYLAVALLATAPAWIVEHPPLQDYPFHFATLRLIHSIHDPTFGFSEVYRLALLKTEYLLYYVIGDLLAFFVGVRAASVGMICLYLGGMPLAMRELLRALGRDERLSLFVVPLSVNVMFCFGLLPFVFGFPIMLLGLAAAARHFGKPSRKSGIVLAVLTVATFYAHILPFAIFGLGCIVLFPWTRPHRWIPSAAPLTLGVGLLFWWVLGSKAGGNAVGDVRGHFAFQHDFLRWTAAVFRDESNETWFEALGVVALAALGLSIGERDRGDAMARGWFIVPVACVGCYFTLQGQLGDVFLYGQRFPIVALLAAVPLLRMPSGGRGLAVTAAALAVCVASVVNVCKHFIAFEREEVGDLDDAIDAMEPRAHVAGLIFDKGSMTMSDLYVPFLHYVSYYQAEKGGVVQFAYTGFPHWPVQYQDGQYPPATYPRLRLRWEWTPEQVPIQELFPYYDYVLERGSGFNPPPGTYHVKYHGRRWTVFARDGR